MVSLKLGSSYTLCTCNEIFIFIFYKLKKKEKENKEIYKVDR